MKNVRPENLAELLKGIGIGYQDGDIEKLEKNIVTLDSIGLSKLNDRLLCENKGSQFLKTLAEHNFAANLMANIPNDEIYKIQYEPCSADGGRPPDLHIVYKNTEFWIQIKRLSSLERDNRQDKIFKEIDQKIRLITADKVINLSLAADFLISDIDGLIEFIKQNVEHADDREVLEFFSAPHKLKASVEFRVAKAENIHHLRLGSTGDLNMVDVTGLSAQQIRDSFLNAHGAFVCPQREGLINIIVAEVINPLLQVSGFCEALYGTEMIEFNTGLSRDRLFRQSNGLFFDPSFYGRVGAVIGVCRKEQTLVCEYKHVLCVNPHFEGFIEPISSLLKIDEVINGDFFPSKGFFERGIGHG